MITKPKLNTITYIAVWCIILWMPSISRAKTHLFPAIGQRSLLYTRSWQNPETKPETSNTCSCKELARDVWYGVKTSVYDLGYVYSSPIRINTRTALYAGTILALGGVIYAYDQHIYDAVKRNQHHQLLEPILEVGEILEPVGYMGNTNKYYFAALAVGYITNYKPLLYISCDLLESYFIAGTTRAGVNYLVGRRRPRAELGVRSFKIGDGTSFPSGHASNVMQIASVLSHHIKFLPVQLAAYGAASAVCLQRISSASHWPSDVYFGAILGYSVAHELLRLNSLRRLKITPSINNNSDTAGLSITILL